MGKSDLVVTRDDDGNVEPINGISPVLGLEVKVVPLTYGQSKSYPKFGRDFGEWSDQDVLRLLKNQFIEVEGESMSGLTLEDLQNMEAWTVSDLLQTVALYSGLGRLFKKEEVKKEDLPAHMS